MSHKGKNSASSAKGKKPSKSGGERKSEDLLQAVVLADSFQDRFRPFTVEKPRCLLPLGNTPLIEYTLEFLAMNGVSEVYIYCGSHTDQVEDYVNRSRWSTTFKSSPFTVLQFVRVADARSVGDVLRDLDKRSLVDGDFILVHGDLVSNVLLDAVLAEHRKRREENAGNIMTLVLTSGGTGQHRTKSNGVTPVFAVDTKNKRCLHYDEINPLQSDHYVMLDPAVPDELSTDFEVRADLVDAQIDICTPEVLALWSESFDYELPRRNFLHGVLKDWELNGKMIYAEVLDQGYAARASNLQMYDAISRDLLDGWSSPFSPLSNMLPSQSFDSYESGVVMEAEASQANDAEVSDSVIGRHSTIGSGCKVSNSFVGRDCKIGDNVTLENCFIWNDVTVEDGTRISQSIVADSAWIGKNCTIEPGALISFGVKVTENTTVAGGVAVSTVTAAGQPASKDTDLLGSATNASAFAEPEEDEVDEEDPARLEKSLIYSLVGANLSTSSVSTLSSDVDSDDSDGEDGGRSAGTASPRSRLSSFASDDSGTQAAFHTDAVTGLVDALRAESGDFDSAKLEFMGLRLANDASDSMMRRAIGTAFARRAVELLTPEHGSLEPSKAAERALTARPGAVKFISEVGVGAGAGERDQAEFALALQRGVRQAQSSAGVDPGRAGVLLAALFQQLYALDIVEEEGILAWWADERAAEGEGMSALRDKCKVLVEWLENAEEEDDDDDSSDDE